MMFLTLLELAISSALLGVIWLVQLLQYPSFLDLDKNEFKSAMKSHQDRISFVVIPLMLGELFLAVWMVSNHYSLHHLIVLVIVLLIWVTTFTLQVPLHQKLLDEGFHEVRILKLVRTNWIRTFLWTVKLIVVFGSAI